MMLALAERQDGTTPPFGASHMRPFLVRQHGRILFTICARSKRHALALITARLSDTAGVTVTKGGAR
jgi:hypothetical protein